MTTKTFPTLYCQNEDGSMQEWTIWVENGTSNAPNVKGVIRTRYGKVGGALMETSDVVSEGKNKGKKNETTPVEQAIKEATSKWEKKQKDGYHQKQEAAAKGQVDTSFVEGGIDPMLAHKYRDHAAKMMWPALAQPKFDGIRCIAVIKKGSCTLWSRTRKQITGVPHVKLHLERVFAGKDAILDGELYNHDFKADFEKIVSYVRQSKAKPGHEVVQYHIYDIVMPGVDNKTRNMALISLIPDNHGTLKRVETQVVANDEELKEYFADCVSRGYEGCMVRNGAGTYQHKRSYNLLKVKEFDDAEFEIVGTEEGRGKMAGKAVFVCKVNPKLPTVFRDDGTADPDAPNQFSVKMQGALSNLAQYLNNKKVLGKNLTVRYQGFTNTSKPRFPVGVAVRDYE